MKVFLIAGKAGCGKNEVANIIKETLSNTVITSFSKYIKLFTLELTEWDGRDITKPREYLQNMGDKLRAIDEDFLTKRILEDLEVYKREGILNVIISDVRLVHELEYFKNLDNYDVVTIRVNCSNSVRELTDSERLHYTETALDTYQKFDYVVYNDMNKTLEKEISLPAGNNTLYITVIDEDKVESTFEKNFESENGVDIINPEISLEVVSSKLVIKATDETKLDFLTYRWNDEQETKVYPEGNDKEIQVELDIMKSSNDITISVVDSNNNTTTETKTFLGVTNPKIIIELSADGSSLDITCKHEVGIEKIEYTLNGQAYEGVFEDKPTEVQFEQALDVGYNRIILTATSVEKTSYTFDGETTYYPEGYDASAEETTGTNTTTTTERTGNTTNTEENN